MFLSCFSITMWDADAMASHVSYQFAHSCAVTDISCFENSTDIFASGGLDHLALLWDRRQSKPARLALNAQHGVTAVAWCTTSAVPVLAVALETGEVAMVDTRQECSVLSKIRPFVRKRPIHKLRHCATRCVHLFW
jgi:WD40 repeat protein